MVDPHQVAVASAQRQGDELLRLFARLGSTEHPRGRVWAAYRNARRAMADVLKRPSTFQAFEAAEVMRSLRREVEAVAGELLAQAIALGEGHAQAQLAAYVEPGEMTSIGGQSVEGNAVLLPPNSSTWQAAIVAPVGQQAAQVQAILAGALGADLILGDGERAGVLAPGPTVREGARWLAVAAGAAWALAVRQAGRQAGQDFRRQAVAAIDERTTDCCLRANAQVVGLEEDFHLTGTPRFADRLRDVPFHWFCRSSVALVLAEHAEDDLSRQMRAAADAELAARARTGTRVEVHPAHARSRRP